jgi:hypothetical protein
MGKKWINRLLMQLSPHDEDTMHDRTAEVQNKIRDRAHERADAERRARDYISLQLQVMRRE